MRTLQTDAASEPELCGSFAEMNRLFNCRYLKPVRRMSTLECLDSVSQPGSVPIIKRDGWKFPSEVMMDVLLYALFCLLLPLWLFGGLYLAVEMAETFRDRYIKVKTKK